MKVDGQLGKLLELGLDFDGGSAVSGLSRVWIWVCPRFGVMASWVNSVEEFWVLAFEIVEHVARFGLFVGLVQFHVNVGLFGCGVKILLGFDGQGCCIASSFYCLLRAIDRYVANFSNFSGQRDGKTDEGISRLKTIVVGLLSETGCNNVTLSEDLIYEMCRYDVAGLRAVAAFIGGIASQKIIKLITK